MALRPKVRFICEQDHTFSLSVLLFGYSFSSPVQTMALKTTSGAEQTESRDEDTIVCPKALPILSYGLVCVEQFQFVGPAPHPRI